MTKPRIRMSRRHAFLAIEDSLFDRRERLLAVGIVAGFYFHVVE